MHAQIEELHNFCVCVCGPSTLCSPTDRGHPRRPRTPSPMEIETFIYTLIPADASEPMRRFRWPCRQPWRTTSAVSQALQDHHRLVAPINTEEGRQVVVDGVKQHYKQSNPNGAMPDGNCLQSSLRVRLLTSSTVSRSQADQLHGRNMYVDDKGTTKVRRTTSVRARRHCVRPQRTCVAMPSSHAFGTTRMASCATTSSSLKSPPAAVGGGGKQGQRPPPGPSGRGREAERDEEWQREAGWTRAPWQSVSTSPRLPRLLVRSSSRLATSAVRPSGTRKRCSPRPRQSAGAGAVRRRGQRWRG